MDNDSLPNAISEKITKISNKRALLRENSFNLNALMVNNFTKH